MSGAKYPDMSSLSTPVIPRGVLFGNPEKVSPKISPDGTRMSYIAPKDGVLNVWVGPVGGDSFEPVTDDRDRGIRSYGWAHDNRHLLYVQDKGGDENWRVYMVDLETGDTSDLTPFEGVQAQIIDTDKRHPDTVLIGLNKDNPQLHDVYRLTLSTGQLEKVAENPGFIGWVADSNQVLRGGIAPSPDGGMTVLVRDDAEGEWRPVHQVGLEDSLTTNPITFSLDGTKLMMIASKDANSGRIGYLDLASGEFQVIAEDPRYDVGGAIVHPDTLEVQAVSFDRDRVEWQVLDPSIEADIKTLQALHDGDLNFLGRDHADRTWLVAYTTDAGPVPYYSYDRETGETTFLFHHQPALADYELARMEPIAFTATDGLEIHGYVTFPVGVERSNLPMVLNVHGGPWARDAWGFNPEAQWFANRGYVCLQVNYRGSTGYGKEFVNAGDKEWAGKMHQDLLDAIDFVVAKGWVDPEQVAIYGGSYGGYAALVGATFTPERFKCAVDIVGPSSIKTLIESVPEYWKPIIAQFTQRVGDPATEEEFLWSRSPLSKVDNISIPLLIAQGANDPRVKQAESEQIVAAMQEKGIPHEYMLFEDEGHGFAKPENRLKFYAHAERFLAQHLGGRNEEPPSDLT